MLEGADEPFCLPVRLGSERTCSFQPYRVVSCHVGEYVRDVVAAVIGEDVFTRDRDNEGRWHASASESIAHGVALAREAGSPILRTITEAGTRLHSFEKASLDGVPIYRLRAPVEGSTEIDMSIERGTFRLLGLVTATSDPTTVSRWIFSDHGEEIAIDPPVGLTNDG